MLANLPFHFATGSAPHQIGKVARKRKVASGNMLSEYGGVIVMVSVVVLVGAVILCKALFGAGSAPPSTPVQSATAMTAPSATLQPQAASSQLPREVQMVKQAEAVQKMSMQAQAAEEPGSTVP